MLKKLRLNYIIALVVLCLAITTISVVRLLIYTDLTITPVIKNPLNVRSYLISYADGAEIFYKNQHALALSAINRGIDTIISYRRQHLAEDFVANNKLLLEQKTGAGMWLWKPYLILETLRAIPLDSILIYADTGLVFKANLEPLLQLVEQEDIILSHYDAALYGYAGKIAKREVFLRLNCDNEQCQQGPNIAPGFMVLRNTLQTQQFIAKWLELCQEPQLLLPGPSSLPEHEQFRHHLYDQAILSVLVSENTAGKYLYPLSELLAKYLLWHPRYSGTDTEYDTIIPYIYADKINRLDKWVLKYMLPSWFKKWLWQFKRVAG